MIKKNKEYKNASNRVILIKLNWYKLGLLFLPPNYTLIVIKSNLNKLGGVASNTRG